MKRITKATLIALASPGIAYWYIGRRKRTVAFYGGHTACVIAGAVVGATAFFFTGQMLLSLAITWMVGESATVLAIKDIRRIVREQEKEVATA
jgi:hypothetical protein